MSSVASHHLSPNSAVSLWMPIAPRLHPQAAPTQALTAAWAVDLGLLDANSPGYERFMRAEFAWLAARCWPDLSTRALQLASDWLAFVFVLDDDIDDAERFDAVGMPTDIAPRIERYVELFAGHPVQASDDALGRAAADLRARITGQFPSFDATIFVERASRYLRAIVWERDNLRGGKIPSTREYARMRIHAGGVLPCLALSMLDEQDPAQVAAVLANELVQRMELAACRHVSWTNDLFSAEKERGEGNWANLVLLLEHESALTHADAVREAVRRIDGELAEFIDLAAGSPCRSSPTQARYLRAMAAGMRGAADWHAQGRRSEQAPRLH